MKFVEGPMAGKALPLAAGSVTFGRLAGCDVQLRDVRVSREHCRVWFDPAVRAYMIADLGSVNGTFVDGLRLTCERLLLGGEEITMGRSRMTFIRHSPTPDPAADADMLSPRLRDQEFVQTSC
jgi:pSer/pThr/pTyr-binding forkhead associated (FHA) protein